MTTVVPDQITTGKVLPPGDLEPGGDSYSIPPLGKPQPEKKFWFQRSANYDPNAIATQVWPKYTLLYRNLFLLKYSQPSVYDVPEIAAQYQPREDW